MIAARRRKTTKFEDSIISGTDIKTNTVFGSTGGGVVNTGDNSLASDFSREGLGNIDTDEVDPIAEAEVYLAYGRDAQAEEILKDALKKDPQRQEIYLKLLEIHAQHNKPSAFETVASELYAVCNGQGEVWHKAVALGRQLDPNNPMFAEGWRSAMCIRSRRPRGGQRRENGRPAAIKASNSRWTRKFRSRRRPAPRPRRLPHILAGAESELEKTAKHAATRCRSAAADRRAGRRDGCGQGCHGNASGERCRQGRSRRTRRAKFDLDFKLDEAEKPAPMGKPRAEPALATTAAEGRRATWRRN